jgi:hypothetical protein
MAKRDPKFSFANTQTRAERERSLVAAMSTGPEPMLRDLLVLIHEDAFTLEDDDPFTVAECFGWPRSGPMIVDVLAELGLPTDRPMDSVDDSHSHFHHLNVLLRCVAGDLSRTELAAEVREELEAEVRAQAWREFRKARASEGEARAQA